MTTTQVALPTVCTVCKATESACENRLFIGGRRCCVGCRHLWSGFATNTRLPYWLRVHAIAELYVEVGGDRVHLGREELHHLIDPTITKPMLSRAIKQAVSRGLLTAESSARCLVLARG